MCKVFAMSNMAKFNITKKFVLSVKDAVTDNGKGDKDGFGYSVLGQDGSLGGERTTRVEGFIPLLAEPDRRVIKDLPFVNNTRNSFGTITTENAQAFIGHGRYSTNEVNLENTHPYYNGEVSLIHNGVVRDPDKKIVNLKTTNDTEILLRCWEQGQMPMIEETVTGYYALAILESSGKLHIIRDDRATLYISYCRTVDSYIFATTSAIIKKVARDMKWHVEEPEEVQENVHIVFQGNDFTFTSIQPRVVNTPMDNKTRHSLGITETAGKYGGSYEGGWGGHYKSEAGVIDATKPYLVESEESEEPSYREEARQRREIESEIEQAELDRALADDGAPSLDARFCEEITESYINAYNLKRRIS